MVPRRSLTYPAILQVTVLSISPPRWERCREHRVTKDFLSKN